MKNISYIIINKKEIAVATFSGNINEWESFPRLLKSLVRATRGVGRKKTRIKISAAVKARIREWMPFWINESTASVKLMVRTTKYGIKINQYTVGKQRNIFRKSHFQEI